METIIKKVREDDIDEAVMEEATELLRAGKLVAFPTETVYGLGADGLNAEASKKIYAAKGRPSDNPLILHIAEVSQLDELTADIPEAAKILMDRYWPGPLTMIFRKSEKVPYSTTGGLDTVAIRMPSHPVARRLLQVSKVAVAAPSANTSGRPSPTLAEHVKEDLDGKIDMIIDGGEVGIGIESTIVDVTGPVPMILRPGFITLEMLEDTLGEVSVDQAILHKPDPGLRPKAPGMKYKHYAPKGDLTLVEGEPEAVTREIQKLVKEKCMQGYRVGVIATEENKACFSQGDVKSVGSRNDLLSISHNLYRVLREFDTDQMDFIYGEAFDQKNFGQAVMNRLNKAAGYKIIKVSPQKAGSE